MATRDSTHRKADTDSDRDYPLDRVSVTAEAYWSYVRVTYSGAPKDLLSCGAIEPGMECRAPQRRPRIDSFGDRFTRKVLPRGRIRVRRFVRAVERVITLPGLPLEPRECIRSDVLWLLDNLGRIHVSQDEWRIVCVGSRDSLEGAGFGACLAQDYRPGVPHAHPVMNGFWAITVEKLNSDRNTDLHVLKCAMRLAGDTHTALRSVPGLRLVVDNTRRSCSVTGLWS